MLSISAGNVIESVDSTGVFTVGNDTTLPSSTTLGTFPRCRADGVHAIIRMKAQSIDRMSDFSFTLQRYKNKVNSE
jgi:hypothetical protein